MGVIVPINEIAKTYQYIYECLIVDLANVHPPFVVSAGG